MRPGDVIIFPLLYIGKSPIFIVEEIKANDVYCWMRYTDGKWFNRNHSINRRLQVWPSSEGQNAEGLIEPELLLTAKEIL